jgi:hypothetical protein
MKSIDEAGAQARVGEILEETQHQPIVIRRHDQERSSRRFDGRLRAHSGDQRSGVLGVATKKVITNAAR